MRDKHEAYAMYKKQMDELRNSLVMRRMVAYCIHVHGFERQLTEMQVRLANTKKGLPPELEDIVARRRADGVRFYDEGSVVLQIRGRKVRIAVDGNVSAATGDDLSDEENALIEALRVT